MTLLNFLSLSYDLPYLHLHFTHEQSYFSMMQPWTQLQFGLLAEGIS